MGNWSEQFMDLQLCAEYSKFPFYKLDPAICDISVWDVKYY